MSERAPLTDFIERAAKERGELVRIEREAAGWSQAELAERAGTNQQTVDRIERGITTNSKAYPSILDALGMLPNSERAPAFRSMAGPAVSGYIAKESKAIERINSGDHIPVFQLDGQMRFVDAIPRPFPVEFADGAFAVIIQSSDMAPAFWPGDLAVINPNLPALPGSDVVLGWQKGDTPKLRVRHLLADSETEWVVKTWRPDREERLAKNEYPRHEVIVSRIARYR